MAPDIRFPSAPREWRLLYLTVAVAFTLLVGVGTDAPLVPNAIGIALVATSLLLGLVFLLRTLVRGLASDAV